LPPSKKAVFSSKTGIRFAANCSNYGARFMAVIPLHADYKPAVTSTRLSLAYKRRRRRQKKEKKEGKTEKKRTTEEKRNERGEVTVRKHRRRDR
jgi:hypothetical protein